MTWTSRQADRRTLAALLAIDWSQPCPLTEAAKAMAIERRKQPQQTQQPKQPKRGERQTLFSGKRKAG